MATTKAMPDSIEDQHDVDFVLLGKIHNNSNGAETAENGDQANANAATADTPPNQDTCNIATQGTCSNQKHTLRLQLFQL